LIRSNTIQTRIYQQILFGTAIKDDSLIVLPTGLGKTVVFIMVIAHYLKNEPEKKVIVTAPTRPLVNQHHESLINMLRIDFDDVIILSGETAPSARGEIWNSGKVYITTPQTLRNDIIGQRVDLTEVSLLCFDEAHRAVGDHPYVLCAQEYRKYNENGRILGFTASPGDKDKVYEILENLRLTSFEYMDENHPQVKPYVHEVDENWVWIDLPEEFEVIQSKLKTEIKDHLQYLKDLGIVQSIVISNNSKRDLLQIPKKLNASREQISDDNFFGGMAAYGQLMLLYQAAEMLETQGIHTLLKYIQDKIDEFQRTNKNSLRRFTTNSSIRQIYQMAKTMVADQIFHPKLTKLKEIVTKQINQKPESRILIFANYKATTEFLVEQLSVLSDASVHRFVGQSSSSYGKGLTQKQQKNVMDAFKSGIYNILVSTSVGEEGLDVAQCDLVIFYDVTPSATRFIQRSGRTGRARKGEVVILITKGTRDEGYFYASRRKQKKIRNSIQEIKTELAEEKENKRQTGLDDFFNEEQAKELEDTGAEDDDQQSVEFNSQQQIIIYIDHRERGAGIVRELLSEDIDLRQSTLPVGDFILSDRVAVERKTTRDFTSTLIRGDLFEQLINLKSTYIKPILLIEGNNLYASSMSPKAIQGAITSIMVDYDIPIIFADNEKESIEMLLAIAKREQRDKSRAPTIRASKSTETLYEDQIVLLSALPNINNILAERILEEFKTPQAFFAASPDQMRKVHGIGTQIANRIDQILTEPYDWEDEI